MHQNNGPGSYMVSSCIDSEIVSKILSARFKYLNNYRKGTCSLTFLKKNKPAINSPNFVTVGYWMLEKSYTQYHLQMDSAGRRQVWLHDSINPISRVHVNIDSVSNRDCRLVSGVKYV